ncbi:MAG: UDP-N-acetylmuramoyl-L-alanine--D-glutamate ligase [Planctomycetota bacterium]
MPASAVIMGLGTFGGGLGAARHLLALGHEVLITDLRTEQELAGPLDALRPQLDAGVVTLRLGAHNVSDMTTCELLVVNPAVKQPWTNRFVRSARAAGVRVTTELGLAIDTLPSSCRLTGVTGSAGKSTTASMVHAGLTAAGRPAHIGGNLGGSLLDRLGSIAPSDDVVIEVSSAQLWWLSQDGAITTDRWFDLGVITNITPNHIDWHGSLEHYTRCKHLLVERLPGDGVAVLGPGMETRSVHEANALNTRLRIAPIASDADLPDLLVPGGHNRLNARVALAACAALGADPRGAAEAIAAFRGLPHRLAAVAEHRGVLYINDSKSTTPEATRLALDAMGDRPVHLIVGGSDKGADLEPIARLAPRTRSLLCIGQTGRTIAALAGIRPVETLASAVEYASGNAAPGDAVLLSPGCASFDQFASFEERGRAFERLVHSLA